MNIGLFIKDFAVGRKFSDNGLPTKSGAEFHAENHALQLINRGNHVTIMAKKRYGFTKARENLNGIDLVRLHAPFRWLEILLRLFTTHRHFDSFYIMGRPQFAVWAILYARIMEKPVTMALTGVAEIFMKDQGWRTRIFASCDHYIAISQAIKEGFVKGGGIPEDKIEILPQGIDTERYPVLDVKEKKNLRRRLQLSEDGILLLFCARIVIDKGVDTLCKVWRKIYGKFPTAKLIIVGGGRTELVEELQTLSDELGNSIILTGEVDNPRDYYQVSDIYIFPSRHEGLPTTLMESMSCGLPAVTSDIGGCSDLIEDGKSGFRVGTEDVQAFTDKVEYLLTHEEERVKMGREAARFVREYCDYSRVIWRLEKILAKGVD